MTKTNIVVDSVRAQIINLLKNGQPTRFLDIKNKLHKHDFVIKRELDLLVERNWIIKTGLGRATRYMLNLEVIAVSDYLRRFRATPDAKDDYHTIVFDLKKVWNLLDEQETEFPVSSPLKKI